MTIAERIKTKRTEKNLTQKALGKACGMSGVLISQYEAGIKTPKIVSLKKIALALDVTVHYFLDFEPDEETLIDKITGFSYNQMKVYADAFDMTVPQFLAMTAKQGVAFARATMTGEKLEYVDEQLAQINALKKESKQDSCGE